MKYLIVVVGLPRSGKSTWSRNSGHPVVNKDAIRLALHGQRFYEPAETMVHATSLLMADSLLRVHDTVIVDECNVTAKRRSEWQKRFERPGECEVNFHVIWTSPQECIRRAKGDEVLVPVIQRMAEEWDLQKPPEWSL